MKILVKYALLMMIFVITFHAVWTLHASAEDIITTVAGNGFGFSGDGGLATDAQLSLHGVFVDSSGNIFIADTANHHIRKVNASTGIITTIAGNGIPGFSGDGGLATSAQLHAPRDVFVDSSGNILIADQLNHSIRRIDVETGIITTLIGNGIPGFSGDGGLATSALLNQPFGVSVDGAGNILIADLVSHRIRKIDAATGIITTVAGSGPGSPPSGFGGFSGDGGLATSALLNQPFGVSVDGAGNIYIADSENNRIRKVAATTGIITTVAGSGPAGFNSGSFGGDSGPATSARLNSPLDVFVDSIGNIFIADTDNHRIRKVDTSGVITTVAGTGIPSFSGDGGLATNAKLNGVSGVFVDGAGNIFIADHGNSRIRKIHPALPPTLTSISPFFSIVPGASLTITLSGTNFTLGMTVDVSGTGITVSDVVMNSNTLTSATAIFAIDANATLGVRTISITALGGTSNTVNFTINTTTTLFEPTTSSTTTTTTTSSTTTTTTTNITTTTTLPLNTGEVWQFDNHFTNVVNGKPQDNEDTGVVTVTTILVGDTVKWTNRGTTEHTTTNDDDFDNGVFQGDLWDSGGIDVGETFSHTFGKAGEFPYLCLVHGREDEAGTIVVKSSIAGTAPIANFIADKPLGIVPLTVRFTDISTGNPTPTEWLWDFGDGGASIEQNPSHLYDIPGLYSVALTVKNSLGEDSLTKTDFINAQSFFDKSFTFNCDHSMKRGFFGLESLVMNVGDIENCTLKLTNHVQGQTKEVSTQITNWFWSGIKIEPARSVTDENGELRVTITAVKKGSDWAAWAVPNDKGQFQFNKKTYDIGLAWGMFVRVE
ncbi:MAG: NHL domain-containing protein [Candidatus Anammoxibacter sp.]